MKTIILIGHKKRQGKDTFASMLAEITGGQVIRFADPMKQIIATTFGVPVSDLEAAKNDDDSYIRHDLDSRYDQTYRDVLQRFGTEAMKSVFGERVWADLAVQAAEEADSDVVIFPDLRFHTEALVMQAAFERTVTVNINRLDLDSYDTHSSETDLDSFHYDISVSNSGTLEDLKIEALCLADALGSFSKGARQCNPSTL